MMRIHIFVIHGSMSQLIQLSVMIKQEIDFSWESQKITTNSKAIYQKGAWLNLNLNGKR